MKRLRAASSEVTIGTTNQFRFKSGDRYLQSVEVTQAEQERASSCSISLFDPDLVILNIFLTEFQRVGGIMVPTSLLKSTNAATATQTAATSAKSVTNNSAKGDELAKLIVAEAIKQGVTQDAQIAYILATAQVETSMGQTLIEQSSGAQYEGRSDLGNTQPGDGARFKGGGIVQVTGRINYAFWTKKLGVDFIAHPELIADLTYAIPIAVIGMRDGTFTGKKLSDYINSNSQDFVNARRIINGLDKAATVAGYAKTWLVRISSLKEPATAQSSSDILANLKDPGAAATQINVGDGILIAIAQNFNDSSASVTNEFFLTAVKGSNKSPNTTTIQGKQVRAVIATGKKVYTSYQNISVKELATRIAQKIGATVEIEDIPQTREIITSVAQSETDYGLLLKAAKSKGLFVRSQGKILKIEPLKASDTTVTLPYLAILPGSDWGDTAASDRILSSAPAANATATTPTDESSQILAGLNDSTARSGILALATPAQSSTGVTKGFEGNLIIDIINYPEALRITPGVILAITGKDNALYRAYRVGSTRSTHAGSISYSIGVYLPVASNNSNNAVSSAGSTPTANPTATTGTKQQGAVAKAQPAITGQYMLFIPLKTQNSAGAWLYQLQLVQGTTVLDSVQCVSGFVGYKPVPRNRDRSGSGRPCPAGTYDLPSVQQAPSGSSLGAGLGNIFINVSGTSPRAAIGIHWDSNLNSATAGCLGTVDQAGITKALGWWNNGAKKLVIDYGDFESV